VEREKKVTKRRTKKEKEKQKGEDKVGKILWFVGCRIRLGGETTQDSGFVACKM